MLADSPQDNSATTGAFHKEVQLPATSRHELLEFIADQLPVWRDRPDRPTEWAETSLTSQLCTHLNSVARHSAGWDMLQFRVEEDDETVGGRKLDLVAAPCGVVLNIEGRRHCDFEPILPVECKRLPTPKEKGRDEREYVFSATSTTGGIARFRTGLHGATHNVAGMIAYVQDEGATDWLARVNGWIDDLKGEGWTAADRLVSIRPAGQERVAVLRSAHARVARPPIELRHLWVRMN